jgi:hypothetical protein
MLKLTILLLTMTVSFSIFAKSSRGSEGVGGGDLCENRIKIIRDDLSQWINNGGPQGLKLPSKMTVDLYSTAMLSKIKQARIKCVSQGDPEFPVKINGVAKTCRFDVGKKISQITCDFEKFQSSRESDQYVLIHHEYAGMAKLENPKGSDSTYFLSNQISGYLINVLVKKLSIVPASVLEVDDDENTMKNMAIAKFLKEANDFKSSLGSQITQINFQTMDGRNQEGIIQLPVKREDLQVVLLESEEITNPWHYANKNETGRICSGEVHSIKFLILLAGHTGVHYATEFSTHSFKVDVEKILMSQRKDGGVIQYCDELGPSESENEFLDLPDRYNISEFEKI